MQASHQGASPEVAALAKELYDICDRFAEVAAQTERIGDDSVWEQVSAAFSTASLNTLLAPETTAVAVEWRRKLENWIGEQLQARWQDPTGQMNGLEATASHTPAPQPPVNPDALAFGLHTSQPATPASLLTSSAPSFAGYPAYDGLTSPFHPGHSPTSSMDSAVISTSPYGNVPSPFLSPFHFPGPLYYAPPTVNGLPVQLTPTTNIGAGTGFGELEVDHHWDMGLINFANSFGNGQVQQQQQPQPPVLDSQITRRPSPVLPRLITTDLSPSSAFNPSPTINISRSPTPEPSGDHGRSRSLSASNPSTPGRKAAHHRRLSSGASSPRFHPFKSGDSLLTPDHPALYADPGSPSDSLLSPSALMAGLELSSPHSPASSCGGDAPSRVATSHKRSRSSETRSRAARTVAYDENAVFLKNEQHVFVVHTQTRSKAEITEQDVLEIDLDPPEAHGNRVSASLNQAIHGDLEYTPEVHLDECKRNVSYGFTSNRAGATTRWTVSFGLDSSVEPPRPVTSIRPRQGQPNLPAGAAFTFVHFVPGTIVVSPTYPMGSSKWWRVQECPGRHENCPGDGSWTARWDEEGEERRPSRIVQHYASCSMRKSDGDAFALGKLARAVRKTKPKM